MINVVLIGAGNVMENRHVPALKKNKKYFKIIGVIDSNGENAKKFSEKHNIPNFCSYEKLSDLKKLSWFKETDAAVIAVPPMEHYNISKFCIQENKHVFIEKPFVTKVEEAEELVRIAKSNNVILCVNENFQYSNKFLKLEKYIKNGTMGEVKSIYCIQTSSRNRKLPNWLEDARLPMGLVYDEAPHALAMFTKLFENSRLNLEKAYTKKSSKYPQTPQIVNLDFNIENIPVSFYLNFECPICEWFLVVYCTDKVGIFDCFKDVLIILPNDGKHGVIEVFKNSFLFFIQYFFGLFKNSFLYFTGNLLYGMDNVYMKYYNAIENNENLVGLSGDDALYITKIQHEIIEMSTKNGDADKCQKL